MKALHVHLKQFNVFLIHIVVSTPTCTLKQFISLDKINSAKFSAA